LICKNSLKGGKLRTRAREQSERGYWAKQLLTLLVGHFSAFAKPSLFTTTRTAPQLKLTSSYFYDSLIERRACTHTHTYIHTHTQPLSFFHIQLSQSHTHTHVQV